MKRSLTVAALATVATTSVFAQSNVTIYGRLNASVERQKQVSVVDLGEGGLGVSESNVWALQNSASRIGFKGTEDLGGGLKAGFQIEHGFNVDTGAATGGAAGFWGRQAEVNLGSTAWGTIRLGRFTSEAYFATADYVSMHNHDTGTSADALYAYIGRNSNKVAYRTPELVKGLSLEGAFSLKESTVDGTFNTYDFAANYDAGPLHLGFGYEKADFAKQFAIRALYEMGAFTFGGYIQRDTDAWLGQDSGSRTNIRLSAMYTMGPSEFHLNIGRAGKIGDIDGTEATQATVGYNYNLSKRTKVYAFYTKLGGDGADGYATLVNGGVKNSFALGVRHNF
jgi:predicted porin